MNDLKIHPIAYIRTDLPTKFGVPRQAGLVEDLEGEIVFEKEYRVDDALRGLDGFSHIWLIWQFSKAVREDWSPTVRPPRLGGNDRMGVFATRSPFRPNNLGLSCVRLISIDKTSDRGTILRVAGADLMDDTPIFDIKPYIPYADCKPDALSGFAPDGGKLLRVIFEEGLEEKIPENKRAALRGVLANDPRPRYQDDAGRIYGIEFAGMNVKFKVNGDSLIVIDVNKA